MNSLIELKNIKVSFILKEKLALNLWKSFFVKSNIIFKVRTKFGNLRITIYPHNSKHINLTGLQSLSYLPHIINTLQNYFQCKIEHYKIDNLFYSIKNKKKIKLSKLYLHLKKLKNFTVSYNPDLFAGIQIKSKKDKYAILLFSTGSVCILGQVNPQQAQRKYDVLIQLINYEENKI